MQNPKTIQTFCNEQLNIILTDISRGKKHATRIHGASGIGKTAIIKQLVVNLSAHTGNEWGFETINCANHSAVDLTGVPTIVDGKTVFAPPEFLPDLSAPNTPQFGILFIDEIDKAKGDMINAILPLIYEGVCVGYVLPTGWFIFTAQNRTIDKAGSTNVTNTANVRRAVDIGVYACPDELVSYAEASGWRPEIASFLTFRPELVHEFPNGIDAQQAKTRTGFACPATWELTNDFLHYGLAPEVLRAYLADGVLGEAVAVEFCTFLKIIETLPNWKLIFSDGYVEPPTDVAVKCALIGVLAHHCVNLITETQEERSRIFAQVIDYCHDHLDPAFGAIFVRRATAKCPDLIDTKAYLSYKNANQDSFIG